MGPPAISPDYLSILHQRILDDALTAEIILTEEIVTHLRQEYPAAAGDILSANDVSLWQTETEFPFMLLLVSSPSGTEVCIELGEEGYTSGLVINDTAESLCWAEAKYDEYKQRSERVSV